MSKNYNKNCEISEICFGTSFKRDICRFYTAVEHHPLSCGTCMSVENGFIRRVTDKEINSLALEIAGTNVSTTYIYTPKDPTTVLGIGLPFLIMIIKNMKRYFTFEITILDDQKMRRRFRGSNFQSSTKIRPFSMSIPIGLGNGWNQIQFNLADFTKRAYGTNYIETIRMQIHANCRIRRIYFADRLYTENELPDEYKMSHRRCVREIDKKTSEEKMIYETNVSDASRTEFSDKENEEAPISPANSKLQTPEELAKSLEIHVPNAYENASENLSEESSVISGIFEQNKSLVSFENVLEVVESQETFEYIQQETL